MHMSSESLLVILLVGLVAGWLAGQIVQGTGFGILGDLLILSNEHHPSLTVYLPPRQIATGAAFVTAGSTMDDDLNEPSQHDT